MKIPRGDEELIRFGEPPMGGMYGVAEVAILNEVLRASMEPAVGFRAEKETLAFEEQFTQLCQMEHAIAFNGAGGALDLLLKYLDIQEGDEVVSCSINFMGTHLAIIGSGANLVLCEPDPNTLNLSPEDLKKRLTPKTKAIVVTYMNGLAADMDEINRVIADFYPGENKPKVIVDAARSLGTTFKGKHIGREAWATFFSFQSKKMITTLGEGGMVVTNDSDLDTILRQYRSFGKNEGWGSNYKMTKLQAAVGSVQLGKLPELVRLRRELAQARNVAFSKIEGLQIQKDTSYSESSYYLYTLILPEFFTKEMRDALRQLLEGEYGIGTVVGNAPTYKSNKLIERSVRGQELPIAESLGERIICLPIHPSLTPETNQYIIDSFLEAYATCQRAVEL